MNQKGRVILITSVLAFLAPLTHAATNPSQEELLRIRQEMERQQKIKSDLESQANKLEREAKDIQKRMVSAAKEVRSQENKMSSIDEKIKKLEDEKEENEETLKSQRESLVNLMASLQKLSLIPMETFFLFPEDPAKLSQSAMVIATIIPEIQKKQKELEQTIVRQEKVVTSLRQNAEKLEKETKILSRHVNSMDKMVKEKNTLQDKALKDSEKAVARTKELVKRSKQIEELLKKLEKERRAKTKARPKDADVPLGDSPFAAAAKTLPVPVQGKLVKDFGEPNEAGSFEKGLSFQTRASATVIAPFDGKVSFRGHFMGYGELVILDHGDHFYSLLAGIGQIDVNLGSDVLAGEPVGKMPNAKNPVFYFEIRKDGQPINPKLFLKGF